jgi:hypothetical protein
MSLPEPRVRATLSASVRVPRAHPEKRFKALWPPCVPRLLNAGPCGSTLAVLAQGAGSLTGTGCPAGHEAGNKTTFTVIY